MCRQASRTVSQPWQPRVHFPPPQAGLPRAFHSSGISTCPLGAVGSERLCWCRCRCAGTQLLSVSILRPAAHTSAQEHTFREGQIRPPRSQPTPRWQSR